MDDARYGQRDKRGHWKPFKLVHYPPVFVWPAQPLGILKWLFGYPSYLLPWNLLYAAIAAAVWLYLTPATETLRTLAPGWIAFVLARNLVLTGLFFGAFHLRLYIRRSQGDTFKYHPKWLDTDSPTFLRRDQTTDNMFWTLARGVPIWTAHKAVTLRAFANGYIPWLTWTAHPLYLAVLMLAIPLLREVHFYRVHRLLHAPALYRTVHKLHHDKCQSGPVVGPGDAPGRASFVFFRRPHPLDRAVASGSRPLSPGPRRAVTGAGPHRLRKAGGRR